MSVPDISAVEGFYIFQVPFKFMKQNNPTDLLTLSEIQGETARYPSYQRGGYIRPFRGGYIRPRRGGYIRPSRGEYIHPLMSRYSSEQRRISILSRVDIHSIRGGYIHPFRGEYIRLFRGGYVRPFRGGYVRPFRGGYLSEQGRLSILSGADIRSIRARYMHPLMSG